MAKDNQKVEVNKGDVVEIEAQGIRVKGTVTSAEWYKNHGKGNPEAYGAKLPGKDMDGWWYIEVTEANIPGGYSYWKQREDGGKLVTVNGKVV